MIDYLAIKEKLYKACAFFVEEKYNTVTASIESYKKALFSETKSSAGDKHETGRAMLQLEMEKAGQQLTGVIEMKKVLNKITFENSTGFSCLGSLIFTNKLNYFLAISAGKIIIENKTYYAISTNSPIGQQLLGKKVGDSISFNKAKILNIL
ncbi:GreA/GreB family elongation factor [Lutibacter sp.]|uniref:GreA/GreB family elongation factor n=1 Tax=Lutibacter sp. TaxID=1925666 RepID=UPI0025C63D69|nr:GreA/GreB family elongation factor [Lutibacter sp.]MCF6168378.1 GreA/GreB family elongation factor [Lutibacter sp.]